MEKKKRDPQPFKLHKSTHKKVTEKAEQWAPYNPYAMLTNHIFTLPWMIPQQAVLGWFALQQKWWEGYWNLISWQYWTMHQLTMDNSRGMINSMQLASEPKTLYRYMRMNWKKPYEHNAANALTASRLYGQIWADCFLAWQNSLAKNQAGSSPDSTHK